MAHLWPALVGKHQQRKLGPVQTRAAGELRLNIGYVSLHHGLTAFYEPATHQWGPTQNEFDEENRHQRCVIDLASMPVNPAPCGRGRDYHGQVYRSQHVRVMDHWIQTNPGAEIYLPRVVLRRALKIQASASSSSTPS